MSSLHALADQVTNAPPGQVQQTLVRALSAVVDNLQHAPQAAFDLSEPRSEADRLRGSGVELALELADVMLDLTTGLRSTHPAAAPRTGIPADELEGMARDHYQAAARALASPVTRQLVGALAG